MWACLYTWKVQSQLKLWHLNEADADDGQSRVEEKSDSLHDNKHPEVSGYEEKKLLSSTELLNQQSKFFLNPPLLLLPEVCWLTMKEFLIYSGKPLIHAIGQHKQKQRFKTVI